MVQEGPSPRAPAGLLQHRDEQLPGVDGHRNSSELVNWWHLILCGGRVTREGGGPVLMNSRYSSRALANQPILATGSAQAK